MPFAAGTPTHLSAPAAGVRSSTLPTLSATFSDTGDSGAIAFQMCSDAACTSVVTSGTSANVGDGVSSSWAPGALTEGAYFWRAQSTDSAGKMWS